MGRILEAGLQEVQQSRERAAFIDAAAGRFEALGTPQALSTAQLIRENPEAATHHVEQFGGWNNLYNLMRADKGRTEMTGALQQLGGAASQQEVLQRLLPIAINYGIGGDLMGTISQAYGKPAGFEVGKIEPKDYTPESFAAATQAGNPTLLRRAAPADADPTAAEIQQLNLEEKRANLPTARAKARVIQVFTDDAAGKPISKGDAAFVNNFLKQYPNPLTGQEASKFTPQQSFGNEVAGGSSSANVIGSSLTAPAPVAAPNASGPAPTSSSPGAFVKEPSREELLSGLWADYFGRKPGGG